MSDSTIETFEHAGLQVTVGYDEFAEDCDPRDAECNLGTMVCWHPDYVLGDEQFKSPDGRGAIASDRRHSGQVFETEHGRTDIPSMEALERYLRLMRRAAVILPLYLLDHSGLHMSAGSNTVGRGDTASGGRDSWGNPHGWDTTMCGFIYTTAERIAELCGPPQLPTDPFYCPRTWPADGRSGKNWPADKTAAQWIAKQLDAEVDVYSDWLAGAVYYYVVEDDRGDVLDSCGGFLGGAEDENGREIDGLDYTIREAKDAAEGCRDQIEAKRRRTMIGWALAHRAVTA